MRSAAPDGARWHGVRFDRGGVQRHAARLVARARSATGRVGAAVAGQVRPSALWRRHRLMTFAVLVAAIPRLLAMIAFRPALLTADSFLYMREAVNHHLGVIRPAGYPMFLTGAGVKKGFSYGSTDEYGIKAVEGRMHNNDLHATLLALMGLDHEKLTFRHSSRDERLTDVSGEVISQIVA